MASPSEPSVHLESRALADAAMRDRRYGEAVVHFEDLAKSEAPDVLCALAAARLEVGDHRGAREAALKAAEVEPGSTPAALVLARADLASGNAGGALAGFVELSRRRALLPGPPLQYEIPAHFALHNLEQCEYLEGSGAENFRHGIGPRERQALRGRLVEMITRANGRPPWVSVRGPKSAWLGQLPYVRREPSQAIRQLNADVDWPAADATLARAEPKLMVIDDFLAPGALAALREFCLGSTIWRHPYKFGYVAAFPEDGLATAGLFAIAEELRARLPSALREHRLTQWWCFAYDSRLPATAIHADDSDISLNLWLTPDLACEGDSGLIVWNREAPTDWSFDKMNAGGGAIRAYLRDQGADKRVVDYRANRAVIFSGRLFHESDRVRFAPGFENRRRNLTLLFRRSRERR